MKHMMIAVTMLACACTPRAAENMSDMSEPTLPEVTLPIADQAGNRMEALTQSHDRWCTADGVWCAEGANVTASFMPGAPAIPLPGSGDVWQVIIRSGETALVGLIATDSQMYSGGSAEAEQLVLYSISGGVAKEVVRMPFGGSAMIRACFSEEDQTQRAGACHDEYRFATRISLDEGVADGAPQIILETVAGSYPGRVTRNADSLEAAPLTEADLVWARDETCSYRRTYTQGADGLYTPDQELPACADYLEP